MEAGKPNLFEYNDYRAYLRAMYSFLKSTRRTFSFRFFAREAGFSSPNFLKLVMDGKRNLTVESLRRFSKALKHNRQEAEFFESLVFFNQTTSQEEQNRLYERLSKSRRYRAVKPLERDQFRFYSRWYYSAIRELVTLKGFQENPEWISKILGGRLQAHRVEKAIDLLLKLKLLRRNSRGRLEQVDSTITSGVEVRSLAVANFHREMLAEAAHAMERIPSEERDLSAVTLGVPASKMKELKERIAHFRKDLLATIVSDAESSDRVYQLNIQLFPLTEKEPK